MLLIHPKFSYFKLDFSFGRSYGIMDTRDSIGGLVSGSENGSAVHGLLGKPHTAKTFLGNVNARTETETRFRFDPANLCTNCAPTMVYVSQ